MWKPSPGLAHNKSSIDAVAIVIIISQGTKHERKAQSPAGQTANTWERLGCESLVKTGWVCFLWKNSPSGGIPVLLLQGRVWRWAAQKAPVMGGQLPTWLGTQEPWRFLSREVAGESGVPGSCLDRQETTLSFLPQCGHAESPQVGYLISLCYCLFSCMMISEVLKKWVVFLNMEIIQHCRKIQTIQLYIMQK